MHGLRATATLPALLLGLSLVVAACGGTAAGGGGTTTAQPAATAATAATAAPATPQDAGYGAKTAASPAAGGTASIGLGKTALGTVLTDGNGSTLYMFTADSGGASACYDACAAKWPPLTSAAAPTLGTGLDAEDFTSIARTDGSSQVVFYGMPLYYFAGDKAAGDVNGQGLAGKWYVVGADGKPIK